MDVLYSQPLTLPAQAPVPDQFDHLGNEGALSHAFGQRWPNAVSDQVLRVWLARELFRRRSGYGALVTGRYGELFAALQGLWPFGRKPHALLDIEWPHRHGGFLRGLVSRLYHRLVARGAWKIQVFCHAEADHYADYFGIEPQRFVWIPYCTDIDYPVRDGDYLFAGGYHQRDYPTLARAAAELKLPLRIAAPPERIDARFDSRHTQVLGRLNRAGFFEQMAGARLVVLSLQDGLLRCPGVITYVSALRLGKCVIVNEPIGASSYIEPGRTGILTPARDPAALAQAIQQLWDNRQERQEIASRARRHAAEHFSLARWLRYVEELMGQVQPPTARRMPRPVPAPPYFA